MYGHCTYKGCLACPERTHRFTIRTHKLPCSPFFPYVYCLQQATKQREHSQITLNTLIPSIPSFQSNQIASLHPPTSMMNNDSYTTPTAAPMPALRRPAKPTYNHPRFPGMYITPSVEGCVEGSVEGSVEGNVALHEPFIPSP